MVAVKKDKINGDALGTGRRKSAVARVRIRAGNGKIVVNKRPLDEYFAIEQDRRQLTDTLELAGCRRERGRGDHGAGRWYDRPGRRVQDGHCPSAGQLRHGQLPVAAGRRRADA